MDICFYFFILQTLTIGGVLIKQIKIIYRAPLATVVTNGEASKPFTLEKRCRQGCPVSPLLFATAIKPLAIALLLNQYITEIQTDKQEFKT